MNSIGLGNSDARATIDSMEQVTPIKKSKYEPFLNLFKRWMWIAIVLASILQNVFFLSPENLFATAVVLVSWKITDLFLLRISILKNYPVSSIVIMGFCLTQFSLPLIFTLTEGKPIVFNLKVPYQVFIHSFLDLLILILTHQLYINHFRGGGSLKKSIQRILMKYKFYSPPTDLQIWIIGFLGIGALLGKYLVFGGGYAETEEVGATEKFILGFSAYVYAPFYFILKGMFARTSETISKSSWYKLFLYILLVIAVGIACNSRAIFMRGITAVGIAYFFGLLLNKFDYRLLFKTKYLISGAFFLWIITGPLSDLGTSMVMVRDLRNDISGAQLLSKTIDSFNDKKGLDQFKNSNIKKEYDGLGGWNEHYFDNIMLARFCNLKFNDATLELAGKLGYADPKMREFAVNRVWSFLPQPLLDLIGVDANKEYVSKGSTVDYMLVRMGSASVFGGMRLGQFSGTGMAAYGWWYLLVFAVILIPIYFLMDLFGFKYNNKNTNTIENYFSLVCLIFIADYFMFFCLSTVSTSESLGVMYGWTIRGWIQTTVLYIFIFYVARKISYVLKLIV